MKGTKNIKANENPVKSILLTVPFDKHTYLVLGFKDGTIGIARQLVMPENTTKTSQKLEIITEKKEEITIHFDDVVNIGNKSIRDAVARIYKEAANESSSAKRKFDKHKAAAPPA